MRKVPSRQVHAAAMEAMEARLLLAGDIVINEFMADNATTLKDKDGAYSDWIEIYNGGATAVNLLGWYLTDSSSNLTKWQFPSTNLPAGGYLVVFASDKNITTGPELHTSFKLGAGGDYLALVQPDGHTIATEFRPQYPQQYEDISYGYGQDLDIKTLVGPGVPAAAYVPTNNTLGLTWTSYTFDDSGWTLRGTTAVGYESTVPGFASTTYFANTGAINTLSEAESIIATPGKQSKVVSKTDPVINYSYGQYYGNDLPYPGTLISDDPSCIVNEGVATITIPVSDWYTFGVSSDDGFGLTIWNATDSFHIEYAGLRGASATLGSHYFAAGQYSLRVVSFENYGGQSVELYAARGQFAGFDYTNFDLVGDTANGGLFVESLPVGSGGGVGLYRSVIHTDVEAAMKGVNASAYVRVPFTIAAGDLGKYDSLTLKMKYDDGFVAYLNGVEVARRNAPASVTYSSAATAERSKTDALTYEQIDVSAYLYLLREGQNVLAFQGLNRTPGDGDFLILPELVDIDYLGLGLHYFATPSPGAPNLTDYYLYVKDTKFDHDRGFYDAPFDLTITTATEGATIRYTLDGSVPDETTGLVYSGPIHVARTTILRARAFKTDYEPSAPDTQTYIFLDDVITQPADPAGFPSTWGVWNGNPFPADYEMDPNVVNDPAYAAELKDDLKSIPTMSLVMDMDDIFGPSGLYDASNLWTNLLEKPGSLELIYPDGTKGFQEDAGVRIYGGVGRDPGYRKHSFRILFKDVYGATKLDYPLFGDSAAHSFDSIILRANFNDSWVWGGSSSQYIVDQWSRDTQLAMGGLSSHGNFVHLFINGLYWGLYNPSERPDGAFAASYLGGDKDNYDALHNDWISGDGVAWGQMFNLARTGSINTSDPINPAAMASNANYQLIQQYLDVPSLIDYVLMNFYGGNWDWDWHNWYAARNRAGGQFKFFAWDSEGNLQDPNANITSRNTDWKPTQLFQQLMANTEFRVLLMDRIYKAYFNGGPLSPDAAKARYQALADGIYGAIATESARWGDIAREPPLGRNSDWVPRRDWELNTYFPMRSSVELANLRNAGMYPALGPAGELLAEAPLFNQEGGNIQPGFSLTMANPNIGGTIYYTLDGTDPRLVGGGISGQAQAYTGAITLNDSRMVRARVLNGSTWSALHEVVFLIPTPPPLRVTELMYHPANPPVGSQWTAEDFEFIELKNVGAGTLNVGGMGFSDGIDFTFAPGTTIPAGGYAVIVSNQAAFQMRYPGVAVAGQYLGDNLNNGGERLLLTGRFGEPILDFSYDPDWYPATNGEGFSLYVVDPLAERGAWGDNDSWWISDEVGGTPGADPTGLSPHSIIINELLAHTDADPRGDWVELKNASSQPISIGGWYLSDDLTDLTKYRIAPGTTLQPGEYYLLSARDNFLNPADPGCRVAFSYSEYGEAVCLTSANADGTLRGYREVQQFDASDREVPFTRYVKSTGKTDFVAESAPTPLADNACPKVGPVVINEVMYHPLNDADEFIELHNITGSPVPLYDPARPANAWKVEGGVTYAFDGGVSIPAHGYLVLVNTDPDAFRARYGVPAGVQVLGPFTGLLNNAGEKIRLLKPGDPDPLPPYEVPYYLVDRLHYGPAAPWPTQADGFGPSLQRTAGADYGNDAVNWNAGPNEGTPGVENGPTDVTPPRVDSAATQDGVPNQVIVTFNEAVDPVSSHVPANYVIDHSVTVNSVSNGPNNRIVILNTTALSEGIVYTVTISHVQNAAGIEIAPDTAWTFNYTDTGKGLKGQYFTWTDWNVLFDPANLKLTRIDPTVDFYWGGGAPGPGVPADYFAVRWTGSVKPAFTETYTFYTVTDDGVSLWVNGVQLINDQGWHGDYENAGTITLTAGQYADIRMEMYEGGGAATARLLWSSPSTAKQVIPTRYLYDTSRPAVAGAKVQNQTTVAVTFSEEVERDSAQDLANYQVTYPVGQPIAVTEAALLPDHKTAWLTLASPLSQGTVYTVAVANVKAKSGPYQVQAGSKATFTYTSSATGNVLREWWLNIGGNAVSDLTNNPRYPNNPSGSDQPTSFESSPNWDNYGVRMRAYITPPTSGAYTFWIASDDNSQLWLSTNDNPANKQLIAYVSGWTGFRQWTVEANQQSAAVSLTAGQRYYIEALQKEGGGGDHVSVRWQLPGGAIEEPIPGSRLTPFIPTPDQTVSIAATDASASETGSDKGTFTITRTGNVAQAVTVYYTVGGTARTADMQQYLTGVVQMAAGVSQATVDVLPVDDAVSEYPETVRLTLVPDRAYLVGAASGTVTIADNDVGKVTGVTLNNRAGRGIGSIEPSGLGIQAIRVMFSQTMTFTAADLLVQKVTFSGNTETVTETLTPAGLDGSGTSLMVITFSPGTVVDSWVKVTLNTLADSGGKFLDGESRGVSGRTYIYNTSDLPSGNNTPGGSAVFYVGSLRGDFATTGGASTPDGQIAQQDFDVFLAKYAAADKDADFRGGGFTSAAPDGLITPGDIDGFISAYVSAVAQNKRLAALPNPGPQSGGDSEPLAAGAPESVVLVPDAAPSQAAPEVDVLATVLPQTAGRAPSAAESGETLSVAAPAAATMQSGPGAGLTVDAVTVVPLASSASADGPAMPADPVLAPDGGVVDLLALAAVGVPL
jgi:hypothetical protein